MTFAEFMTWLEAVGEKSRCPIEEIDTAFVGARIDGTDLVVEFRVDAADKWVTWFLRATRFQSFLVEGPFFCPDEVTSDHPLLGLKGPTASIAFRGLPRDIDALLARIYEVEEKLLRDGGDLRDWPFRPRRRLLSGGYGTIYRGPLFLMKAYLPLLREAGIDADLIGQREPRKEEGQILLTDSGYIIADAFDFESLL